MFPQLFHLKCVSVFNITEVLFVFLSFVLVFYLIYYNYKRLDLYKCSWKIPGPISYPVLGSAYKFMFCTAKDIQPTIREMSRNYGKIFRFWLGPELNIFIIEPKYLEKILLSNCALNKGPSYKYMQNYLGRGLLTSGGKLWKNQRKAIAPCFNKKILENHLDSFNIFSNELVKKLSKFCNRENFNIFHEIVDSVNKSVCETILGVEPSEELREKSVFTHHVEKLYDLTFLRMSKWCYQFDILFNNSKYVTVHNEISELLNIFFSFIHSQKFKSKPFEKNKTIALDTLIDQKTNFRDFSTNALTLQTASEESISTIVSFMLLVLGIQKDIQKKLSDELDEVFENSDRFFETEDLSKLKYLDLVVKETLRMFPIGTLITRFVDKSFNLTDDLVVPKGCVVTIPIFAIHRHPELWDQPEKFIPERFLPENSVGRHPLCYLPFSHGPMNCIGQTYAIWCMKVFSSTVLRYFEIDSPYKSIEEIELRTDISIRPVNGYLVKLSLKTDKSKT